MDIILDNNLLSMYQLPTVYVKPEKSTNLYIHLKIYNISN